MSKLTRAIQTADASIGDISSCDDLTPQAQYVIQRALVDVLKAVDELAKSQEKPRTLDDLRHRTVGERFGLK